MISAKICWRIVGCATAALLLAIMAVFAPYWKALAMAATQSGPQVYPMPTRLPPGALVIDDWFVVLPIDDTTFAIGEPRYGQCNFAYLLVGKHAALLWDSGPGLRNIHDVTSRLTSLPVTAMPSHFHFDHVGGLKYFADVALPDVAGLRQREISGHLQLGLFEYLGMIEGMAPPALSVTRWIKPGSETDLGSRKIRILAAAGHTDNSTVLLDERTGNLFTGDTIYPGHVWDFLPGTDLRALHRTVRRLQVEAGQNANLFGGHGCNDPGPGLGLPKLDASALQSLQKTIERALEPRLALFVPRTITSGGSISLDSKASWMAK